MDTIVTTDDGLRLRVRDWPCADARGTVVLVHGLGEHIGRYLHVAAHLNDWGWNVVGYDQRGHGASEGARGRLEAPDDLLRDLARVLDGARSRHPGLQVLLGHSLGGLVAARFVAEGVAPNPEVPAAGAHATPASRSVNGRPASWHRAVDALVLSSPALATGMSGGQKALLGVLGPLAPTLAVANGLKPAWISRDADVVARYVADPAVHDRVTPRLVRFIVDGGSFVRVRASGWTVPTLLLYAGSDRCVAPAGSAEFVAAAPPAIVSARVFEPLFHEIFNEPEQAEVFAVLRGWLADRAARAPHRAPPANVIN